MDFPEEGISVSDLYQSLILLLDAPFLGLRTKDFRLDSQDTPGFLLLKMDANAGIELTIIAT